MVFSKEDKELKMLVVNCNCGCDEELQIRKYKWEPEFDEEDEYYFSIHTSKFALQKGIFRTIGHRIKLAFKMLIGKEYLLCDIVMKEHEFEEFKQKIKEF